MLLKQPWRISGIAGLFFVLLSFVASLMNVQAPLYDQDQAVLMEWFAQNGERFRVGHFIAGLAFLLFYFPFFAGFCERLRVDEGNPAIWSRVAWAGAIMSPAAGTASGSFIVGAALLGGQVPPNVAAFAAAASFYAYVVSGALTGIVMIGAAVVILRTRVFTESLGWAAAVVGLTAFVGSAAVADISPVGFFASVSGFAWLAYFAWISAASIAMIRTRNTVLHR